MKGKNVYTKQYVDNNISAMDIQPATIGCHWCVNCGEGEYAKYIYKGFSLCQKCLDEAKEGKKI